MKISIHQPNFFPHLAFFKKVEAADVFVILSHCQFEKNGFQNRFQMDGKWFTMSTSKALVPIRDKTYTKPIDDWQSIKRRLKPRDLDKFDQYIGKRLSATNTSIIKKIVDILRIRTKIVNDYTTRLTGSQRLVDICKRYDCDEYISGPSGPGYMNMNEFGRAGIKVTYQKLEPTVPIFEEI